MHLSLFISFDVLQELHDGVAKIYLDDEGITKKAIDELFSSIDTDGDGYIDKVRLYYAVFKLQLSLLLLILFLSC
jgi:Ca2+-binding EF-hand superfamily protein